MSHIKHTICRSGTYYYNRRVPKQAVKIYGSFIRQALSTCPTEAAAYVKRLNDILEGSWSNTLVEEPVNIPAILESFHPKRSTLSEIATEYLSLRQIDQVPPKVALATLISLVGDRDVRDYTREDAKVFIHHLRQRGNKTATIRRRINSLSAIMNYAYAELELDKRNPFARLIILNEGKDISKRRTFNNQQLKQGYDRALASGSTVKLLMPLLGETGCRLAEIVGLRLEDIDLENSLIHIRPNPARRLKTRNSTRTLPIVGYARIAMEYALIHANDEWLFPQYIKAEHCYATHASNALNKWLRKDFDRMTAHCLRHTMRDRLRAIECPMDMIDQMGGWRSVGGVGIGYGVGYQLIQLRDWFDRFSL